MPTNSPALFYRGFPAYGSSPDVERITTAALTSNLVTLTTAANHGQTAVGMLVTVQGVGTSYDGIYPVHSFPALNQFTYVKTASNITSASVTPNGSAIFNTLSAGGSLASNGVINGVATITTGASHGLVVGDVVAVNSGTTGTETAASLVTAIPSATTFQFNTSTTTVASTALTQGAWSKYPAVYTLAADTDAVITNLVLTNSDPAGPSAFTVTSANTALVSGLTVAASSTVNVDLKSLIVTTGDKIVVAATRPSSQATISGMSIV
jgi:hypothetical protein